MAKFIHTADIHLNSPLKGLEIYEDAPVEEIRGATKRAFDNLIDLALEENVDFILIAGDLYDGDWKDFRTGLYFARQIGRLSKAGIRVFIVSGNHDAASQITKTIQFPDNVTLFSSKKPQSVRMDDLGIIIHGLSYSSRSVTENLASKYPRCDTDCFNIGLLHTCLNGREGHENYAPCTADDLVSKGYDYWALGHIHKRQVISEDPVILFPGNLQGRHIKETGAKGATLVTIEDGCIKSIESKELDVLRWADCKVDLSECDTRESVLEKVRTAMEKEQNLADGKTLALRLGLEGDCPIHADLFARSIQIAEEIRNVAANLGNVWIEKVKFKTWRKNNIEIMFDENEPLSRLMHTVGSLKLNEDELTKLLPELGKLRLKMPPDLLDEDYIPDSRLESLSQLKKEVTELLIAKLSQHGGSYEDQAF